MPPFARLLRLLTQGLIPLLRTDDFIQTAKDNQASSVWDHSKARPAQHWSWRKGISKGVITASVQVGPCACAASTGRGGLDDYCTCTWHNSTYNGVTWR